jgi:hypothetical protein
MVLARAQSLIWLLVTVEEIHNAGFLSIGVVLTLLLDRLHEFI